MITFSHSIGEKMKHRCQYFTRFGRQFQSLKRQVYAVWTSVSFPLCQRSCLIWRIMAKNDEYNDKYLCRDFFVGFNFWSKLSFQIPEFRVHWFHPSYRASNPCIFIQSSMSILDSKYIQDLPKNIPVTR